MRNKLFDSALREAIDPEGAPVDWVKELTERVGEALDLLGPRSDTEIGLKLFRAVETSYMTLKKALTAVENASFK